MKRDKLAEKIDEYIANYGSYISEIKKKIASLSESRNSSAVILSEPLSVKQKAEITRLLYQRGIINNFFESRNDSDNENFERILGEIRKVINEVVSSQSDSLSNDNNKYHRTIWLSDAARREYEFGVKTYQTRNLMVKAIFGISQFWYELFTKGAHGKYVADYYGRNSPEQSYYYLPHNDRRFCLTTGDFLLNDREIGKFLERREKHWRHLYASEIVVPDNRIERILAYAYLNLNNADNPIYLKRESGKEQNRTIKLAINLSLPEAYFTNQNLKEVYNLTTALSYPLKIQLVLTESGIWCKCDDSSSTRGKEITNDKETIETFLNENEGFLFLSDLRKAFQDYKPRFVNELKNNCFVNDYDKDNAIERFLFNTFNKIIERDVDEKIESEAQRPEIIARLKEGWRKIIKIQSDLKVSDLKLDEDVLLMDRIRHQLALWIVRVNQKQNEDDLRKKRRDKSDEQDF